MIQRHIMHAPGTFAACIGCGREPRHYAAQGSTSQEGPAFSAVAERHQLECAYEKRTGWCATLYEATDAWRQQACALVSSSDVGEEERVCGISTGAKDEGIEYSAGPVVLRLTSDASQNRT